MLIVLVLAFVAYKVVQKKQVVEANRERKCREFLMVALFPNGAAAESFMQRCLAGEPVLPGETPTE